MTRILVLTEKHGTRYFDVTTDEQLARVALAVLTARNDEGYWYPEPDDPPTPLDFNEQDIEKMPASLQAGARKQYEEYQRHLRQHREEKANYDEIQEAVRDKDGMTAWQILSARFRYEYERAELERCEEPDPVEMKWPPLDVGTRVETTKSRTPRGQFSPEELKDRRWEAKGKIIAHHDSHGLLYEVEHEDGTVGCYKTSEFKVLKD